MENQESNEVVVGKDFIECVQSTNQTLAHSIATLCYVADKLERESDMSPEPVMQECVLAIRREISNLVIWQQGLDAGLTYHGLGRD